MRPMWLGTLQAKIRATSIYLFLMAQYHIECEQFLGFSHDGAVNAEGEGTIELSDEEVTTLIQLIRQKGTTDVAELNLKTSHPELYAKLDKAYHDMAQHAETMHWLWEGYENGYYEYDEDELMDYCEQELDFTFEYDEDELDEDEMSYAKSDAFRSWLGDYLRSLSDDEALSFMNDHMDACIEDEEVEEYTVAIPEAIIQKANGITSET